MATVISSNAICVFHVSTSQMGPGISQRDFARMVSEIQLFGRTPDLTIIRCEMKIWRFVQLLFVKICFCEVKESQNRRPDPRFLLRLDADESVRKPSG